MTRPKRAERVANAEYEAGFISDRLGLERVYARCLVRLHDALRGAGRCRDRALTWQKRALEAEAAYDEKHAEAALWREREMNARIELLELQAQYTCSQIALGIAERERDEARFNAEAHGLALEMANTIAGDAADDLERLIAERDAERARADAAERILEGTARVGMRERQGR